MLDHTAKKGGLAALVGLAALLAVPARPAHATDLAEIETRGVLRVLMVPDDVRSFSKDLEGEAPGIDYEVVAGFARLRRLRLDVVAVAGWDRLIPDLVEGRGDVIAGAFTVTDTRKQRINFTVEVMPTRSVVVTRRPHPPVASLDDLRQEKVTVLRGTSMAELLTSLKVRTAFLEKRPDVGLTPALRTGESSCLVHDVQTAISDQRSDPDLQLGMFLGAPASYAYGVRKTDHALLSALDEYLTNLRRSGAWNQLLVKYYGETAVEVLRKAKGE
jgi:ABC-type amino acid transport substrate-binding protein